MVSCKVFQLCISTLPADNIWVYCCKPRLASSVDAPDARNALFNAIVNFVDCFKLPVIEVNFCVVLTTVSSVVGKPSIPSESSLVDAATSFEEWPSDFMTFGNRCKVSKRSIALSIDWLTRFIAELTALKATAPTEKFLIASLILSKPLAPWPALSPPALASSPAFLKPAPPPFASSPDALTLCPACLKPSPPELASLLADLILFDACLKPSPDLWARSELSFTF